MQKILASFFEFFSDGFLLGIQYLGNQNSGRMRRNALSMRSEGVARLLPGASRDGGQAARNFF
jgi:hypothetical protein